MPVEKDDPSSTERFGISNDNPVERVPNTGSGKPLLDRATWEKMFPDMPFRCSDDIHALP